MRIPSATSFAASTAIAGAHGGVNLRLVLEVGARQTEAGEEAVDVDPESVAVVEGQLELELPNKPGPKDRS